MTPLEKFREEVLSLIPTETKMVEKPPGEIGADLAMPCFHLAKIERMNPVQIALRISHDINKVPSKFHFVKEVKPIGPYVNFYADWDKIGGTVVKSVLAEKERYGSSEEKLGKVLIEFAHPNTHKAYHIGHVRNITLGESLSRLMGFAGYDVTRVNYQGDIGPHVAKCLWGVMNLKLKPPTKDKGKWLGKIYALSSQKAESPAVEKEIKEINKGLYAGDPKLMEIWKKTRKWSLDYFDGIYRDFGAKFDRFYFESEVEGSAVKLARELAKNGPAKLSEGAIIMDLEEYKLGIYVLLTQDGTPLYSIKDFILADLQNREFNPDKIIHVVGSEQELHFKQLFKSLEFVNPQVAPKEYHLSYGLVNLESGKMKSRLGQVILYEDLKDKLLLLSKDVTKKKNPKASAAAVERISRTIALGALKYDMIKVSPEKVIVFDWERALSFDGNNAPYLQYTHTRCCSILRKSGRKTFPTFDHALLNGEKERALVKKISEFPESVGKAAKDMRPHYIANYVYELCDIFNEFYQLVPVIIAEEKLKTARLALVKSVQITIQNALNLLGIDAPEKM